MDKTNVTHELDNDDLPIWLDSTGEKIMVGHIMSYAFLKGKDLCINFCIVTDLRENCITVDKYKFRNGGSFEKTYVKNTQFSTVTNLSKEELYERLNYKTRPLPPAKSLSDMLDYSTVANLFMPAAYKGMIQAKLKAANVPSIEIPYEVEVSNQTKPLVGLVAKSDNFVPPAQTTKQRIDMFFENEDKVAALKEETKKREYDAAMVIQKAHETQRVLDRVHDLEKALQDIAYAVKVVMDNPVTEHPQPASSDLTPFDDDLPQVTLFDADEEHYDCDCDECTCIWGPDPNMESVPGVERDTFEYEPASRKCQCSECVGQDDVVEDLKETVQRYDTDFSHYSFDGMGAPEYKEPLERTDILPRYKLDAEQNRDKEEWWKDSDLYKKSTLAQQIKLDNSYRGYYQS